MLFFYSTIILMVVIFTLLTLFTFMLENTMNYKDKSNTFECGFLNLSKMKNSFSMNFFLMTIMFLMFDLEISVIIPMVFMSMKSITFKLSIIVFIIIIVIFLMNEWNQGMLEWNK